jgi:hypothetical protein
MKRFDFEYIIKQANGFTSGIFCLLQKLKFPLKILGYLMGPPLRRMNNAHVEVFCFPN